MDRHVMHSINRKWMNWELHWSFITEKSVSLEFVLLLPLTHSAVGVLWPLVADSLVSWVVGSILLCPFNLLDVLHEVTLQKGVLIRDNLEKVLKEGVGRQGGEVPLQSGEDHQLLFQQLGQLIGVIRVLDQGSPGHRARLHQLASNEDCGRSHQLKKIYYNLAPILLVFINNFLIYANYLPGTASYWY